MFSLPFQLWPPLKAQRTGSPATSLSCSWIRNTTSAPRTGGKTAGCGVPPPTTTRRTRSGASVRVSVIQQKAGPHRAASWPAVRGLLVAVFSLAEKRSALMLWLSLKAWTSAQEAGRVPTSRPSPGSLSRMCLMSRWFSRVYIGGSEDCQAGYWIN